MATAAQTHCTPEEYLALERHAEFKSEYRDGRIVAMTGASIQHVTLTGNVHGELRTRLRGTACRPFMGDTVEHQALFTCPADTLVTTFLDAILLLNFPTSPSEGLPMNVLRAIITALIATAVIGVGSGELVAQQLYQCTTTTTTTVREKTLDGAIITTILVITQKVCIPL